LFSTFHTIACSVVLHAYGSSSIFAGIKQCLTFVLQSLSEV
jgi:hypothetical protein